MGSEMCKRESSYLSDKKVSLSFQVDELLVKPHAQLHIYEKLRGKRIYGYRIFHSTHMVSCIGMQITALFGGMLYRILLLLVRLVILLGML